jgi:hypothetical protein
VVTGVRGGDIDDIDVGVSDQVGVTRVAVRDGDPVVAMAFGPGLTLYAALLRAG